MPLSSSSTLQQTDEVAAVASSSSGAGGGGGRTAVVENQLETTYVGSPPADFLLLQHIFHYDATVVEAKAYADSAPDNNPYSLTIDIIGGGSQTISIPVAQGSQFVTTTIDQSASEDQILKVTTQPSVDTTISDLTLSLDLDF